MKYITDKQYAQANDYYSKSIKGKTDKETSTNDKVNTYLDQLLSDYINDNKSYDDTKTELKQLADLTPPPSNIDNALNQLSIISASKTAFANGQADMTAGNYTEAITEFYKVMEADSNNYAKVQDLITQANNSYKDGVMAEIQDLSDKKDYATAITKAQDYLNSNSNDTEMTTQLNTLKQQRLDQVIADAQSLANNKKYDEAIAELTQNKELTTDTTQIDDLITKYTALIPVNICDLNVLQNVDGIWKIDKVKDNYGNEWNNAMEFFAIDTTTENKITFNVDKKYDVLNGKFAIEQGDYKETVSAEVKIYVDGKQVFSKVITSLSKPIDFNINITNCVNLTISMKGKKLNIGSLVDAVSVVMADTTVFKNP
ncbi:MAG: hypothetical protein FWF46_00445 [Oscillospiraceae bacterium]|nr:hypothetical protein [Oscillospiraceae bacterium]